MKLKQLTSAHYVCDQLFPEDFETLATQGIKSVINNRPDAESGDQPLSKELEQAAALAGIAYVHAPIATQFLTPTELEDNQRALAKLPAPICGFCRSGARAAITWGLLSGDASSNSTFIDVVAGADLPTEALTIQLDQRNP